MRRVHDRCGIILIGTGFALLLYLLMPHFLLCIAAVILIAAGTVILR